MREYMERSWLIHLIKGIGDVNIHVKISLVSSISFFELAFLNCLNSLKLNLGKAESVIV